MNSDAMNSPTRRVSLRIGSIAESATLAVDAKAKAKKAAGEDVVGFGAGEPDFPTPPAIVAAAVAACSDPVNHRYPESEGLPELRQSISDWYERRFEVKFDPRKETLPLIGSKEGIGHMALCFIDPGDIALVPDPGYPVYTSATHFSTSPS